MLGQLHKFGQIVVRATCFSQQVKTRQKSCVAEESLFSWDQTDGNSQVYETANYLQYLSDCWFTTPLCIRLVMLNLLK
jgi:hypothetical protein